MYVVTWSVIDTEHVEQLIDVFGPFADEVKAEEWCNRIKDDPKYKEACLRMMPLASPNRMEPKTPVEKLTLGQIEDRMDWLENLIAGERDVEKLKVWNNCFQKLVDELATRMMPEPQPEDPECGGCKHVPCVCLPPEYWC